MESPWLCSLAKAAGGMKLQEVFSGKWLAEEEALTEKNAMRDQPIHLLQRFDAFGDCNQPEGFRHFYDVDDDLARDGLLPDGIDERLVDFQYVQFEGLKIGKA